MPENLNVVVMLEREVSAVERMSIVLELSRLYAPHFGDIQEACRNNYKTGASYCEPWPVGKTLLEVAPDREELLFIYGDKSARGSDARSSIHIEENGEKTLFTISLPLPRDLGSAIITPRLLATAELAGHIPSTPIVLAGWELEGDIDRTAEDVLQSISDDALCLWVACPKQLVAAVPPRFEMVDESNRVVLLTRRPIQGMIAGVE